MTQQQNGSPDDLGPVLKISRGLTDWFKANECSIALTTYQSGVFFLVGRDVDGTPRAQGRKLERCQGMWTDGQTVLAGGRNTMWRFENILDAGERLEQGFDRVFMPREARVTGMVDIHDISMGYLGHFGQAGGHAPIFVATKMNALMTFGTRQNLRSLWQPHFISSKELGDRCHLNGMAMDGDRAAYVTLVGQSDAFDGWRDLRRNGGLVMDVASNEVVASGLSMPHSPRLYRGKLWVLNSGMGELSVVDPADGKVTPVAFCPGFARGLNFIDKYAIVGLSGPRHNKNFDGLPLDERLEAMKQSPRCGFLIIDLDAGKTVEWLLFRHTINELYDVAVMPDVTQPDLVGFDSVDHMDRMVMLEG